MTNPVTSNSAPSFIQSTADVSAQAIIGPGVKIWHQAQVREGARIGANCIVGKGVYIDFGVVIGDNVKIQNGVYAYHGVTVEEGVFLGPGAILTNDKLPRAINADGSLKAADDWELSRTLVKRGASIGANAVIICGVTVGEWAMVGSGSVVSRDVPDYGLVWGNPARLHGFVCPCGRRLEAPVGDEEHVAVERVTELQCPECGTVIKAGKVD